MDNDSYMLGVKIHSGLSATAQVPCVAPLASGSPASLVSDFVVSDMAASGALSEGCIRTTAPRSWRGFWDRSALKDHAIGPIHRQLHVRRQVHGVSGSVGLRGPSRRHCSAETAECDFRLDTLYSLPGRGPGNRVMGELTLASRFAAGASVYATDNTVMGPSFNLRYAGTAGVPLTAEPALIDLEVVRVSGMPAFLRDYLVSFVSDLGPISSPNALASNGRQRIPLVGRTESKPYHLVGVACAPLPRIPLDTVKPPSMTARARSAAATATSPAAAARVDVVHKTSGTTEPAANPPDEVPPKPPPSELLDRSTGKQRSIFCVCGTDCRYAYVISPSICMALTGLQRPSTT